MATLGVTCKPYRKHPTPPSKKSPCLRSELLWPRCTCPWLPFAMLDQIPWSPFLRWMQVEAQKLDLQWRTGMEPHVLHQCLATPLGPEHPHRLLPLKHRIWYRWHRSSHKGYIHCRNDSAWILLLSHHRHNGELLRPRVSNEARLEACCHSLQPTVT